MGCELLIVGNGPSADTPEVAREINGAEKVLRMNRFERGKFISKRCDIYGFRNVKDHGVPPKGVMEVWWATHHYNPLKQDHYEKLAERGKAVADRIPSEEVLIHLWKVVEPKSPTTGLILIQMAIDLGYSPTIAGFDCFQGNKGHYFNDNNTIVMNTSRQYHAPNKEKAYLAELVKQGKVKAV